MSLDVDAGVTTLIGLNESGKTTILEAIFCFSYGAEDLDVLNPEMASLRDPEQWVPISRRANFNEIISIEVVVELNETDKDLIKKQLRDTLNFRISELPDKVSIREEYHFANSRYTHKLRKWSLRVSGTRGQQRNERAFPSSSVEWKACSAAIASSLPRIWYFPNFLFELPDRFELTDLGGASGEEADKSQFYRSTFSEILSQLGYGATLQTHVIERFESSDRADARSLQSVLLDMGRVITKTIFEGWDRIFGRPPAAQEVELSAEPGVHDGAALEMRIKGPDGYYDLSERSLGFRWFFMFLLMTSFHGNNTETKPLFLLDEPASNLHSTAQAELLKSFENLLSRCRLIYTTPQPPSNKYSVVRLGVCGAE